MSTRPAKAARGSLPRIRLPSTSAKSSGKTPTTTQSLSLKKIMSNTPATPNIPFAVPMPPSTTPSKRKVATVPPSAQFDPPTPPLPDAPPDDSTPRRPRPRIRYSTSSESGMSADSDEETPWWLFTGQGMSKMQARIQRRERAGRRRKSQENRSQEAEGSRSRQEANKSRQNSEEEPKPRMRARFAPSRRSTKSTEDPTVRKRSTDAHESPSHADSLGADTPPRLLAPAPIRLPTFRRPDRQASIQSDRRPSDIHSDTEIPRRRSFKRSNSAPGSPMDALPGPPLLSVLSPPGPSTSAVPIVPVESTTSDPLGQSSRPPRRQMTAPTFPRFRNLRSSSNQSEGEGEHFSDSEAIRGPPRWGARRKMTGSALARSGPSGPETSDEGTPGRPKPRRLNSNLLRLPPPISQHFAHGWPHAGSWQDALYGHYEENPATLEDRTREVSGETLVRDQTPPKKSRRTRRYRQAQMPPTPKGLGFTPRDEEEGFRAGQVNNSEFDWHQPAVQTRSGAPLPSAIMEGDELSRTATRMTEKDSVKKKKRTGRTKRPGEDWKIRWKRMLFLDARLTILIRVVDMAVVTSLLALAITIRQELINLRLPGIIGASTTLIIAFASFTLLHGITAMYREYFGKPIGLWGLRSKMLWVCLDLLFVALWSSILALSTNDYITTPLECTRAEPWWLAGLNSSYTALLNDLDTPAVTSVDFIKATLGIVLPDQVLESALARQVCYRQRGCIALSLLALLLYAGNMVLSLFRIFETVRRSANVGKAIMV